MGKAPRIPSEFRKRPFTLDEARAAGLTRHSLSGKAWRRISHGLYSWSKLPAHDWETLSAWRRILPPDAVFGGATAAWLFGLDLEPTDPVEVVVPRSSGNRSRPGLNVRRTDLLPGDVVSIRGLRTLSLPLTLAGLCLQRAPVEALVAIDMAVRRGLTNPVALIEFAAGAKGRPGMARMRSLALLSAPAESPMETRLRWLLMRDRLPTPEVQVNLRDAGARFIGRADLYYADARLVVEYDGGTHRERLVEDDRRQNLLVNEGFRLLRFTAADIYNRPDVVVAQVRGMLGTSLRRVWRTRRP